MEADAILKEIGENPKQSTLCSAADIANLYVIKPLELTEETQWARIYERGSGVAAFFLAATPILGHLIFHNENNSTRGVSFKLHNRFKSAR